MKNTIGIVLVFFATLVSADAQVGGWMKVIKNTEVAVRYYSPVKSGSFEMLRERESDANHYGIVKQFSDSRMNVKLTFKKYKSHIELFGEAVNLGNRNLCFTLKVIFPLSRTRNVTWSYELDSTVAVRPGKRIYCDYVKAQSVVPNHGSFNAEGDDNGGYGDNLGTGEMSYYPLAALSTSKIGYGWGVSMGIPLVFRLAYEPASGMISEFDLATSPKTYNFPNRAFFKLFLFQYDPAWHMRAAFKEYYKLEPKYFERRVTREGIWLPFTPLNEIKGWKDFGFAFHETDWGTKDRGLTPPRSTIAADSLAHVLSFQYTDPWEIELPITKRDSTYAQVTGQAIMHGEMAKYLWNCAARDKDGRLIARRLKTPWNHTGWAVSLNVNADPDIKGSNTYDFVYKRQIYPALRKGADGVYFDCLEWYWQYDLDYDTTHFSYADYPLTFSSSLKDPRPALWSYAEDYKMMRKIADEMHIQGKYVMGNGYGWIPFEAGQLDLFGSELNWDSKIETGMKRLQFYRALSDQKPIVFLLNGGMDDKSFTDPPYTGYDNYMEKMLFFGFYPSFFSVNSSDNVYWTDSVKYDEGRPFFKKFIPLIKRISKAGWQPITYARLSSKTLSIERFGTRSSNTIYFTVYNPTDITSQATMTVDARALNIKRLSGVKGLVKGSALRYIKRGNSIEIRMNVPGKSTRLIELTK